MTERFTLISERLAMEYQLLQFHYPLQYPTFIEPLGHVEVRRMVFSISVYQRVIPFY